MIGGDGDDIYIVDTLSDVVTENASEGTDTIKTAITYTLADLANIENLTLTGSGTVSATGNSGNNTLTGNGYANTLTGGGGDDILNGGSGNDILYGGDGHDTLDGGYGNDTMTGGAGDDIYYVNSAGDTITENASEGTDSVFSSVTWTLGANVENLTLTATVNGTGNSLANILTGNGGANTLTGGDGNDTLYGAAGVDTLYGGNDNDLLIGGAGNDILWGEAGADTFWFDSTSLGGIDTVKDFSIGQGDILDIKNILVGFDPLTSTITDFVEITTSGADSILKVDRDGTGGTYSLTQIGTLTGITGLTDEAALVTSGNLIMS